MNDTLVGWGQRAHRGCAGLPGAPKLHSMDTRFSLFLIGLAALLAALTWGTSDAGPCSLPIAVAATTGKEATSCAEFWLNRYQTLLSAALAFATAIVAAALLWEQLRANRLQANAALGNLEPEFSIDWAFNIGSSEGQLDDAILRIQNLNRAPITLRRVRLVRPIAAMALHEPEDARGSSPPISVQKISESDVRLNRWIPGRDPAGGAAIEVIQIVLGEEGDPSRSGTEEEVTLAIEYRLHGGTVDLRHVEVTGLVRRR